MVVDDVRLLDYLLFVGYMDNLAFLWSGMPSANLSPYCWRWFKSCCSKLASSSDLIVRYRTQLSANNMAVVPAEMQSGRSFIKSRNSNGPRTLPWGTPDRTGADFDVVPSRMTCWVLFSRNALTHLFGICIQLCWKDPVWSVTAEFHRSGAS